MAASMPGHPVNHLNTYYKVATASEPSSYTFSQANNIIFSVSIAAYSGVNNATPINVAGVWDRQATATPSFSSITTTVPGCMILIGLAQNGRGSVTFTPPSGYASEVASAYGYYAQTFIAELAQAAAGATGALTGTLSASVHLATFTAALNPASTIITASLNAAFTEMSAALTGVQKNPSGPSSQFSGMATALALDQNNPATLSSPLSGISAVLVVAQTNHSAVTVLFPDVNAAILAAQNNPSDASMLFSSAATSMAVGQSNAASLSALFSGLGQLIEVSQNNPADLSARFSEMASALAATQNNPATMRVLMDFSTSAHIDQSIAAQVHGLFQDMAASLPIGHNNAATFYIDLPASSASILAEQDNRAQIPLDMTFIIDVSAAQDNTSSFNVLLSNMSESIRATQENPVTISMGFPGVEFSYRILQVAFAGKKYTIIKRMYIGKLYAKEYISTVYAKSRLMTIKGNGTMQQFANISVGEYFPIAVDFSALLKTGETIVSSSVSASTDNITLSGSSYISGTEINQKITAISAGYCGINFTATTSLGNIYIEETSIIVVN